MAVDFKQAGGFWYTASSFPPESPVTAPDWSHWDEIAKAEEFRGSPPHQVNRHPRVAGHNHQPRIYFCNVTICPPPVVLIRKVYKFCISEATSINEVVMAETSTASFLFPTVHLEGVGCYVFLSIDVP